MQTTTCPECGADMEPVDRFCAACGHGRGRPRLPAVQSVRLTGVDIPFGDLVALLVWLALAAIPAALILMFIGFVIAVLVAGVLGTTV